MAKGDIVPYIKNTARNIFFKERFRKRYNHHFKEFGYNAVKTSTSQIEEDDNELIERLKKFYLICDQNFDGNKDSQWTPIFTRLQGDIHEAFFNNNEDKIKDILRRPSKYNLFYGFENMCRDLLSNKRLEDFLEPEMVMDSLISMCEAVGIVRISNPESLRIKRNLDAQSAINLLEKKFNFSISFPTPFEGEYGVETKNGIISYRAIQAFYQAWKIFEIIKKIPNPSVLEIGGGLGRTAYFSRQFGIKNYTIVDIPMSSLSQGNFLGRVLSGQDIHLTGELLSSEVDNQIKLIHTKEFFSSNREYDLIINIDSLTELDFSIATDYFNHISKISKTFLSINHEHNSFTVNDLWMKNSQMEKIYRQLYWLRRGYAEELFSQKN